LKILRRKRKALLGQERGGGGVERVVTLRIDPLLNFLLSFPPLSFLSHFSLSHNACMEENYHEKIDFKKPFFTK